MNYSGYHLVKVKQNKSGINKEKRKFNQLVKKIKSLENEHNERIQELDDTLKFYYEIIIPELKAYANAIEDRIIAIFKLYKKPERFIKKKRKDIKKIIIYDIHTVYDMLKESCKAEINDIFAELNGCSYEEQLKYEAKKRCEAFGINFDYANEEPDVQEATETEEDPYVNFFSEADAENAQEYTSQKTQKQREKESKQERLKKIQTKNFDFIYKQLAKTLHPDLEKNNEQKIVKEELMKKLTIAYAEKDFFTLLSIKSQWENQSMQVSDEEALAVYNGLLKKQVKTIEEKIDMLIFDPKYSPLLRMGYSMSELKSNHKDIKISIKKVYAEINRLQSSQWFNALETILMEQEEVND